jgi:glycosyltransferase involved in cell wall biosynthesis
MGLFLKDLLPNALHVGYFEWYFQPETTRHLLAHFDLDAQLKTGLRNLPILQELERCDRAVVPTAWQKAQFPEAYQGKLEVIFDGIDTSFFHRPPAGLDLSNRDLTLTNRDSGDTLVLKAGRRVLSYATRGMEPLRGFPEFMRAIPEVTATQQDVEVVIAGADRRAYSFDAPSHGGSWKEYLLAELGEFPGRDRLHFTGLLNYEDYRALLWRSNLHCYFTRPYVTSWSLFEAAACGAKLAVSKGPATEGVVEDDSVLWVDLDDQAGLTQTLIHGLKHQSPGAKTRAGFDLHTNLKRWETILNP